MARNGLLQIVYLSKQRADLTKLEINRLGRLSKESNYRNGFSGLLIAQGNIFAGIIEGPEKDLIRLMEKIAKDDRHTDLKVLREVAVKQRRCASWEFSQLGDEGEVAYASALAIEFAYSLARNLRQKSPDYLDSTF